MRTEALLYGNPDRYPTQIDILRRDAYREVISDFASNPQDFLMGELNRTLRSSELSGDESAAFLAHRLKSLPEGEQSMYAAGFLTMKAILRESNEVSVIPLSTINQFYYATEKGTFLENLIIEEQERFITDFFNAQAIEMRKMRSYELFQPSDDFMDGMSDMYALLRMTEEEHQKALEGKTVRARMDSRGVNQESTRQALEESQSHWVARRSKTPEASPRDPDPISAFAHAFAVALEGLDLNSSRKHEDDTRPYNP